MVPTMSRLQAAEGTGLSRESVREVLKLFIPTTKNYQQFGDDETHTEYLILRNYDHQINCPAAIKKHICVSDERNFYLNGKVNRQNYGYWSDVNPHIIRISSKN